MVLHPISADLPRPFVVPVEELLDGVRRQVDPLPLSHDVLNDQQDAG